MSTNRFVARSAATTAALGFLVLAGAGTASAHVSANPEEAVQGDYEKITFRVPNERPNASTVKVKVTLPLDHPLSSVRTKPVPGWTAQLEKVKLDRPVEVEGAQVTEAVRSITWTAQPGNRIGPGEFNEFETNLGTMPTGTDQLVMPAEQTYDNGEVVNWDAPPPPAGAAEPEHPAPAVKLVAAAGGHSHGAKQSPSAPPHAEADDDTARWLGGAGLAVGALGLGLGAGALLRSRQVAGKGEQS